MSETINTGEYQNSSSGGCGKALLWLFLIALILSCLCCAGFFGACYYTLNSLNKGFVDDPVVTEEKAVETFGELNLPEIIKPHSFLTLRLFGRDCGYGYFYSWELASNELPAAVEEPEEAKDEPAVPSQEPDPNEVSADVSDDVKESSRGVIVFYLLSDFLKDYGEEILRGSSNGLILGKDVTVKRSETIPITINGKSCDFEFSWKEENIDGNKNAFLMVSGSFTSAKETQCNVFIILPGDVSQETVTEVLENIQK